MSSPTESKPRGHTRSPSLEPGANHRNESRPRSWSQYPRNRSLSQSRSRSVRRYRSRSRSFSRSPSPNHPPRSSKIVVEKLTKNVTEAHLREIFGGFGDIQNLDIPINRAFMTNRGTAYILYYDPADAEAAIAHMHEAQLDGAVLSVSIVLPRRAFSRSPPPARGGKGGFGRHRHSQRQTLDTRSSRPSPYSHRSPPSSKRYARSRPMEKHDLYRPRSISRSQSPRGSRSPSLQSQSRSPPRRRANPRTDSPRRHQRRSPSYSSYDYSSPNGSGQSRSRSSNRRSLPRK
ncbi:hypothetical protein ASPWEDRAFT_53160 [Aspergillus wentii DTO 134E9]|uniref:RRM domain-containing protein n=1 Tax=Aspergillus wentii DTO 134E9 TaxID=1073089 RepID=A0A1L9RDW5_ASPWE|nr:uncharacterized protein ASPWEDRAFT_53160 [Aspergillus wentii DTO 134E9]OJJ33116.1 hypothetical protein ASPWEDRAFT_53160 [Aspergillus wentii DTO 134E9]